MNRWLRSILTTIAAVWAAPAGAIPIVSVDVDPGTPGIQSMLDVPLNSSVTIDIVISNVDAAEPLQAYELDLDFDPTIVTSTSVADAGFLLAPVQTVEADISPPDVNLLATTVGLGGATGSGVLAQISFDAMALGTSSLDLNDVKLSAPFGVEIQLAGINDATVEVVPEPSTAVLVLAGLLALGVRSGKGRR